MQWFGKAYGAPYEADCEHVATPAGQTCTWCDEVIVEGDDGMLIPFLGADSPVRMLPYHYACNLRITIGGVNHQRGGCSCCGGSLPPDPPELTARKAAELAVWAFNWRKEFDDLDPFESPGNRGG
jgi:hypothetical protein